MTVRRPTKRTPAPKRAPAAKRPPKTRPPTLPDWSFWQEAMDRFAAAPPEELARIPRDAARNFDHYVDGSPKQD